MKYAGVRIVGMFVYSCLQLHVKNGALPSQLVPGIFYLAIVV